MSATARFQAVEGNWLYPAAQRRVFTHTPFGDNPSRAARNTPIVQLKHLGKTRGTIKRSVEWSEARDGKSQLSRSARRLYLFTIIAHHKSAVLGYMVYCRQDSIYVA